MKIDNTNTNTNEFLRVLQYITYLVYILVWEVLLWVGTAYIVFWLGNSGWWFILTILMSQCAYSPYEWGFGKRRIKDGDEI